MSETNFAKWFDILKRHVSKSRLFTNLAPDMFQTRSTANTKASLDIIMPFYLTRFCATLPKRELKQNAKQQRKSWPTGSHKMVAKPARAVFARITQEMLAVKTGSGEPF